MNNKRLMSMVDEKDDDRICNLAVDVNVAQGE